MDPRCIKFWDDGQALIASAGTGTGASSAQRLAGKVLKELRTMSRFLQKNQASRFSDNAQQKLVDCIASYVALAKQRTPVQTSEDQQLVEAVFSVIKDGLAMPFNVMGTKQKKRLLKWYNELIGAVPDALAGDGDAATLQRVEWSVLGIDDDGYLSLLDEQSGATNESFQVKKKSAAFKQIQRGLESSEVVVVTLGDDIVDVRVADNDSNGDDSHGESA